MFHTISRFLRLGLPFYVAATLIGCASGTKTQPAYAHESEEQIANPASVNCIRHGGNLVIQKRGDGGEYGVCAFEDNRQCEE